MLKTGLTNSCVLLHNICQCFLLQTTLTKINALEARDEDIAYLSKVEKIMKESQNFGKEFNLLNANVNYETITKENGE